MARLGLVIMVAHPGDAGTRYEPTTPVGVFFEAARVWNENNPNSSVFLDPREWTWDVAPRVAEDLSGQQETERQLFRDAHAVVAIFANTLGQSCTIAGEDFPSGTAREIAIAQRHPKPVHIWAYRGESPDGADPDERQRLDDYLNNAGGATGWWQALDELREKLPRFFERCLHDKEAWADLVPTTPVVVKRFSRTLELPHTYVQREQEDRIHEAWREGASRLALIGDGGVGKSFIARRVYTDAVSAGDEQPHLTIFVEPTTTSTVIEAYTEAAEKLGIKLADSSASGLVRNQLLACELINCLRNADWPWLVILDNADPLISSDGTVADVIDDLFQADLLPPDSALGSTLITTRHQSDAITRYTEPIQADVFTEHEALKYLRKFDRFKKTPDADLLELATIVDRLPLALSIAVATIDSGDISIAEWIRQFRDAETLDHVTVNQDDPDHYPVKLGQVWNVALAVAAASETIPGITARTALICAVLSPNFDPGWLWETDEIKAYLTQGEPALEALGRPIELHRLQRLSLIAFAPCHDDETTWPDVYITMHRLTSKAIQGSVDETQVEVAVRACADALVHFDETTAQSIRETVHNLLSLLRSRGREGLIVHEDDGWFPHRIIYESIAAGADGCVASLPCSELSEALETIMPEGSPSLARARLNLACLAQSSGDAATSLKLANAATVDRNLVGEGWDETLLTMEIDRRLMQASSKLAPARSTDEVLESIEGLDNEPLVQFALLVSTSFLHLDVPSTLVHSVIENLKTLEHEMTADFSWFSEVLPQFLGALSPPIADAFASAFSVTNEISSIPSFLGQLLQQRQGKSATELSQLWREACDRLGSTNPITLSILNDYAGALLWEGNQEEAFSVAITGFEAAVRDLDLPETASYVARFRLAHWVYKFGDHTRAIELAQALLHDFEETEWQTSDIALYSLGILADALKDERRYADAAERYQILVDRLAEALGEHHPDTHTARHQVAYCAEMAGDRARAIKLYEELLPDREQHQGETSKGALVTLSNLANALKDERRYGDAAERYQVLVDRRVQALGEHHPDTHAARHSVAYCVWMSGDRARAIELYEELLPDRDENEGPMATDTLITLSNLANALCDERRYGDAAERYRVLVERRVQALGEHHPDTHAARHSVAYCVEMSGDRARAIELYEELLPDRDENEGPMATATLITLSNLANALDDERRYGDAAERYQVLVERRVQALGEHHPDTHAARHSVAYCVEMAGDRARAIKLYEKLLPDREQYEGETSKGALATLRNLAYNLRDDRRYAEAAERYQVLVDRRAEALGGHHPDTHAARHQVAYCAEMAGDRARAIELYEELLPDRDENEGPMAANTLITLSNLAEVLKDEQRYGAAAERYQVLVDRRVQALGEHHPDTHAARHSVAYCVEMSGDRARAIKPYKELLPDREQYEGETSKGALATLRNLAYSLMDERRYVEAAERYQVLVDRRVQALGEHHPDTHAARHQVAYCVEKAGDRSRAIELYEELLPDREQYEGETSKGALATLRNLAYNLTNEKRYAEAAEYYLTLAERRAQALGEHHPDTNAARFWAEHCTWWLRCVACTPVH